MFQTQRMNDIPKAYLLKLEKKKKKNPCKVKKRIIIMVFQFVCNLSEKERSKKKN
jgi:hypothetical protein